MVLGLFVMQLAWALSVPPFRGSDEFDHAYRAAAVARGEWVAPPGEATRGTGAWLTVPDDIVEAARAQCEDLAYTGEDDCVGTPVADSRSVKVASGAGRYNPVFYFAIGAPALPFDGAAALYAMRGATILCALGLFALAVGCTAGWARTRWPFVALALATTPVLVYSATVASPNGVEIMAGLALWSALVGLTTSDGSRDRLLLWAATLSGCVLVTLRSFGPLWCLLIVLSVLVAAPPSRDRLRDLCRSGLFQSAVSVVVVATLLGSAWTLSAKSFVIGVEPSNPTFSERLEATARQVPVWLFQSIAAFPLRNESTVPIVYACFLVLGAALLVIAARSASTRLRLGLATVLVIAIAVPFLVTLATVDEYGTSWQGRYGLPYSIGLLVLAGLALDLRRFPAPLAVLAPLSLAYVIGQAAGLVDVLLTESADSPQAGMSSWLQPSPVVAGILVASGAAMTWLCAVAARDE
jgi:hypothetical protein